MKRRLFDKLNAARCCRPTDAIGTAAPHTQGGKYNNAAKVKETYELE